MKVLIVKISSMGDIVHTLPSLTDAVQAIPDINFDWVVEEDFAQIPSWHKSVNRVIKVAIRRWSKAWFSVPIKAERKAFRNTVRSTNYDAIIDTQGLIKSAALITRLAHGIKHGMDWQTAREPLASLFYNRCYHLKKRLHAVESTRELFAKSLGYHKPKTRGLYAISLHFMNCLLKNNTPYLMFIHATTCDAKHWPEECWRQLISLLGASRINIKLPWLTPHEEKQAKRLAKGFDYVNVLPRMNLDDVAKLLAGAKAIVSVDTGLSHLTAALNRPNITLYGPTDPSLIGSYGNNQYVCRPKYSSLLSDISAVTIFKQLEHLLTITGRACA